MYLDSVCPSGRPAFEFDRPCWTWVFNSCINDVLSKLSSTAPFLFADLESSGLSGRGIGFPRLGIFGLKVNSTQGKRMRDGEFNCFWLILCCFLFAFVTWRSCVVYSIYILSPFFFVYFLLWAVCVSFSAVNRAIGYQNRSKLCCFQSRKVDDLTTYKLVAH